MSSLERYIDELKAGDDRRAEAAVTSLAAMAEAALPELAALLREGSAHERWWAARTLAEVDAPQATTLLIDALADPHPEVSECAALGLGERRDPSAVEHLIPRLAGPHGMLARLAVEALVKIGKPAVPGLLDSLRHGDPSVRSGAARALASIADPQAIPALFSALDDDSALVQYWANAGLDAMGVGQVYFKPS